MKRSKFSPETLSKDGLLTSFNLSFDTADSHRGWLFCRLMRECPVIVTGLRRAGFRQGWLTSSAR